MLSDIIRRLFDTNIPIYVIAVCIPLLFLIFLSRDRRARYLLSFFCWGVFSVALAFILNEWFSLSSAESGRVSFSVAPIVEEALKALPLLLFFRKRAPRNLVVFCAFAAGIGFSIVETVYYFASVSPVTSSQLFPVLIRTVTTCLMHGMTTAVLGVGIAATLGYAFLRAPMLMGLLAVSATLHSLFNVLLGTRLAIVALAMPAVLYVLGLLLLSGGYGTEIEPDGLPQQ